VRRFHQLPYRAGEWSRSRKLVARVEATDMGTDARFIVTNLEGRGKTLYEKVFCARGSAENLIKALDAIGQDRLLTVGGKPVPALPAHGRLLAAACVAAWGAEALALARSDVRDHPAHLRESRRSRRGVEGQD
jgi:hypothetical protein